MDTPAVGPSAGMFFVPDGPPTSHVEESVHNKIRLGEFVEMNRLVRSIGDAKVTDEASLIIRDGRMELNTRGKPIDRFEKFFDAFVIFMTIRGRSFPEEYPGMLKHFETVKRLCYQGKAGIHYDRQFRTMKADYPQLSWSQYMPEFVNEHQVRFPQPSRPGFSFAQPQARGGLGRGQSTNSRKPSQNPCHRFNTSICSYNPCRFRHVCQKCGSQQHAAKFCRAN